MWYRAFGSSSDDRGQSVALATNGDVVVAGGFGGTVDFGGAAERTSAGLVDAFVAEYGQESNEPPASLCTYGADSGWARANDVTTAPDGGLVVGGFFFWELELGDHRLVGTGSWDGFVARFGRDGHCLWSAALGGSFDQIVSRVALDGNGAVVAAGYFETVVDFGTGLVGGTGGTDAFVVKYSPVDGSVLWAKPFGSTANDWIWDVEVNSTGDVLAIATIGGVTNLDCDDAVVAGESDVVLLELDGETGACLEYRLLGGPRTDEGYAVALDSEDSVAVAGVFEGEVDFGGEVLSAGTGQSMFLAVYDAVGTLAWAKRFGGQSFVQPWAIAFDDANQLYVTGTFGLTASFGGESLTADADGDFFVAKYSNDGQHQWSNRFGGPGAQYGNSVTVSAASGVTVTGGFEGTLLLGGTAVASAGEADVFVLRLSP